MIAPETRLMAEVEGYGEVMDEVKTQVLGLVGEKLLGFQKSYLYAWFGDRWQRERDARSITRCPQCGESPGFERRGQRLRHFCTRYGKVESALL